MRIRLGAALASAITITFGWITLLGLLLGDDLGLPENLVEGLQGAADVLLQLVTIIIAMTIIIGVMNLLFVHVQRIVRRNQVASSASGLYSVVMILSFVLVVVTYITDRDTSLIFLETIQIAIESSLAGLLLFTLVYGAYRLMYRKVTGARILFLVALLIVLIGALPLSGTWLISDIRNWLLAIPVSAGARGILLGIALATIVTGVRVLVGVDRSYRE